MGQSLARRRRKPFTRAWGSYQLATLLEPWSVRDAALITGMAPGYVAGMLERNPDVAENAVVAYMPMGSAPEDFELVRDAAPARRSCSIRTTAAST